MTKKVYVVSHADYGIEGVYSNKKAAYEYVIDCLKGFGDPKIYRSVVIDGTYTGKVVKANYQNVIKEIDKRAGVTVFIDNEEQQQWHIDTHKVKSK